MVEVGVFFFPNTSSLFFFLSLVISFSFHGFYFTYLVLHRFSLHPNMRSFLHFHFPFLFLFLLSSNLSLLHPCMRSPLRCLLYFIFYQLLSIPYLLYPCILSILSTGTKEKGRGGGKVFVRRLSGLRRRVSSWCVYGA